MTCRFLPPLQVRARLAGWACALPLGLLAPGPGWTAPQEATPRDARLEPVEGSVALAPAGEREWMDAKRGRNLQRGDRLWIDPRSRAEVQVGRDLLRLEGPAHLHLAQLTARSTQLNLTQGTLLARVRTQLATHHFDLNTPNLAFRAEQPGDYRIDVDRARGITRVAVLAGRGTVYGASGQRLPVTAGQQIEFGGTALAKQGEGDALRADAFSRWNATRDQQVAAAPSARSQTAVAGGPPAESRAQPTTPAGAPRAAATVRESPRVAARAQPAPTGKSPATVPADSARRDAWQREQAALSERWKRDHAAYEARRAREASQGIAILRQTSPMQMP